MPKLHRLVAARARSVPGVPGRGARAGNPARAARDDAGNRAARVASVVDPGRQAGAHGAAIRRYGRLPVHRMGHPARHAALPGHGHGRRPIHSLPARVHAGVRGAHQSRLPDGRHLPPDRGERAHRRPARAGCRAAARGARRAAPGLVRVRRRGLAIVVPDARLGRNDGARGLLHAVRSARDGAALHERDVSSPEGGAGHVHGRLPGDEPGVRKMDANPLPAASAGLDQTLCSTSATLAANAPTTGIGTWTIVSGAGGSFVNANSPTTVFNGVSGTTYDLQWTISNGVCTSTSDNVQIKFDAQPTAAAAGPNESLCSPSAVLAANAPVLGTGQWTDREWSRRKFCKCKQSNNDLQWSIWNHLYLALDYDQWCV